MSNSTANTKFAAIWAVVIIGIFAFILILFSSMANKTEEVVTADDVSIVTVGYDEFKNEIDPASVVLDIRTAEEIAEGKIANAMNIDFYSADFSSELSMLDKDTEYLVYCRSGNRSGQALELMRDLGFKDVKNLDGGIVNWQMNGGEICTDC